MANLYVNKRISIWINVVLIFMIGLMGCKLTKVKSSSILFSYHYSKCNTSLSRTYDSIIYDSRGLIVDTILYKNGALMFNDIYRLNTVAYEFFDSMLTPSKDSVYIEPYNWNGKNIRQSPEKIHWIDSSDENIFWVYVVTGKTKVYDSTCIKTHIDKSNVYMIDDISKDTILAYDFKNNLNFCFPRWCQNNSMSFVKDTFVSKVNGEKLNGKKFSSGMYEKKFSRRAHISVPVDFGQKECIIDSESLLPLIYSVSYFDKNYVLMIKSVYRFIPVK